MKIFSRLGAPGSRFWRTLAMLVLAGVMSTLAWRALRPLVHELTPQQALAALRALPPGHLLAALGLTVCSYLLLTFYDRLALRMVESDVPLGTMMRASFTSYTLSHTLGFGAVTGGSARLRIYGQAGVSAAKVARVVVIAGIAFWVGLVTAASLALLVNPAPVTLGGHTLPAGPARLVALAVLVLVPGGAVAARFFSGRFTPEWARSGWLARMRQAITLPHPGAVLALVGVSTLELSAAAAALYVLLPHPQGWHFAAFILAYAMGMTAGLVTHVPGGLGVFEAVLLAALPEYAHGAANGQTGAATLAALLGYRIIYYMLPLVVAVGINLMIEGRHFWVRWRARRARRHGATGPAAR
ncbi:MAG: lysylphosphatidylglycerol synthase domain-containing protein [Novosphingobium aromaticivorans]|nr:lysylphosphatidylglycerol synthase domain-containing protein [Novosphingobium aromaticivorans]